MRKLNERALYAQTKNYALFKKEKSGIRMAGGISLTRIWVCALTLIFITQFSNELNVLRAAVPIATDCVGSALESVEVQLSEPLNEGGSIDVVYLQSSDAYSVDYELDSSNEILTIHVYRYSSEEPVEDIDIADIVIRDQDNVILEIFRVIDQEGGLVLVENVDM